jgi:hypothetical protein
MQDDSRQPNWRSGRPPTNPAYPPTWRGEPRLHRSEPFRRPEPSLPPESPRAHRSAPQDGQEARPRRSMPPSQLEPPRARRSDQFRYSEPPLRPERPQPPRRRWRLFSLLGAAAALVIIAAVSLALLRSHTPAQSTAGSHSSSSAQSTAGSLTSSPAATQAAPAETAYTPSHGDLLSSVSMSSTDEGWAVGSSRGGGTLLLHYHDGSWQNASYSIVSLFNGFASPSQVVMLSASEGWIAGSLSDATAPTPFGFILHYSKGHWTVQSTIPGITLSGLAMLSASEGWAVGSTSTAGTGQSVLLHYSGGTWTRVPSTGATMDHIVMTSSTDGWIVGTSAPTVSSVWHYTGAAWTATSIPGMDPVSVISMVSGNDVWAIGAKANAGAARAALAPYGSFGGATVFEHYDGKTWSVVPTPNITQSINVTSLAMDAPNDGWALGFQNNPNGQPIVSSSDLYLHYTGGQWVSVKGPAETESIGPTVFMLSASEGWAVGDGGMILHYQQGVWNVAVNPAQ